MQLNLFIKKIFLANKKQFFSIVSRILGLLLQMLIIERLTQLLGIDEYGKYVYIYTIVSLSVQLDFGLSTYIQNQISKYSILDEEIKISKNLIGNIILLFFILLNIGLIVFAVNFYLNVITLELTYQFIFLFEIVLYPISIILSKIVLSKGHGEFLYYSQTLLLFIFYIFINMAILLQYSLDVYLVVSVYFLFNIVINFVVFIYKGLNKNYFCINMDFNSIIVWLKDARGFWSLGLIGIATTQVDTLILGYFSEFDSITIYSVINKIFFGSCFTMVSIYIVLAHPKITEYWQMKNYKELSLVIKRLILFSFSITIIFIIVFDIYKLKILGIFIDKDFIMHHSYEWIYIYYIFFVFRVSSDIGLMFFLAISQVKFLNIIIVTVSIFSFILQILFYKNFNIFGLIFALLLTYLIYTISYFIYYKNILNVIKEKKI